jgi:hypothetical protein
MRDVATTVAQRIGDRGRRLALGPRCVARQAALGERAGKARQRNGFGFEHGVHVGGVHRTSDAADREPLERVLELAHVARPGMQLETAQGLLRERRRRPRETPRDLRLDRTREQLEIAGSRAQRRHAQARHVEPVIQVGAEASRCDLPAQVEIRRNYDARPHAQRHAAAHALEAALLEHAQQCRL